MKKKNDWIFTALILLFAGMFLVSAVWLGVYYLGGRTQESRYRELAQLLPTVDRPQPPAEGESLPEATEPETVTVDGRQLLPRFLQLYTLNPDIVGWLQIPGTKVDYPVMQTPQEPEYYLKRNFDKKSSGRGCIFAQAEADLFAPSDNVTLYGHHMKDGSMFGQLDKFRKKAFFEDHRYLYFDTLEESHTYEILAVFKTTVSLGEGFHYHEFVEASDREEFDAFVARCKQLSFYDTGVEATYGDKLLTLSTCEYSQTNGRLVVVAKQVA